MLKTVSLSTPAAPLLSSSLSLPYQGCEWQHMCWGAWEGLCWNSNPYPTTARHTPAMDRGELWETDAGRGKEGETERETARLLVVEFDPLEPLRRDVLTGRSLSALSFWEQVPRMVVRMLLVCVLGALLCQVRKSLKSLWCWYDFFMTVILHVVGAVCHCFRRSN